METPYIIESKNRCLMRGLSSGSIPHLQNRLSEAELKQIRSKYSEVISVMDFFGDKTCRQLDGIPILIALTDHEGYIIGFFGNEKIKDLLHATGMQEGCQMSEKEMGTNAVCLAMQEQQPIVLLGEDHFHIYMYNTACYSVPFHFEQVDGLSGTISMMTYVEHHSPFAMPLLSNMVDSMEREIVLRRNSCKKDLVQHMLIHSVNNGILITDQAGVIIESNQLIEKITNTARSEMIGQSIWEMDIFACYLRDVIQQGSRLENQECVFTLSADNRMTCLLDAMPIVNDKQERIGAYLQLRDITERNDLENQMLTYEKFSAIGKLAAGIAHEIRNPLTSIMGFIKLLLGKSLSPENHIRYLEIVHGELQDLSRLVSDFVHMAKPSYPEKQEHSLQNIVIDTVQFMTSQANFNNVIITTDLCEPDIILYIDAIQMKQVLINLIQNAIEAMPRGGQVDIQLSIDAELDMAMITIRDYGVGISEEQMDHVFNPFFTTKANGLGLGLSICYRIIENHGGTIQIKKPAGYGTQFTVTLPLSK